MKKQTLKQRKAIRSAAAKKGWETRRVESAHREMTTHDLGCWYCRWVTDDVLVPYMTRDWPFVRPPKRSFWQRIKGWFA